MHKPRIAYILHSIPQAKNTTRYQRIKALSNSFDLYVFANSDFVPEELKGKFKLLANPFRKMTANSYLFLLWSVISLSIIKRKIDIVITSFHPIYLSIGFLARKIFNITWIADIYDMPNLQRETFTNKGVFRLIKLFLINIQEKFLLKNLKVADKIFCTLHPDALSVYKIPKEKLIHLTNGIDLSLVKKCKKNKENSKIFKVIYVGYILKIRGIDTILKAANVLKSKYPYIRWELIGPSNKYDSVWFQGEIEKNNLKSTVIWHGVKRHDETLAIIAEADVCLFTFPRTFATNYIYPIKIFEYMSFGKPIITTNLKGVSSILKDKETALFVEPGDPIALASAVEQLYNNPELRIYLGENAKREVHKYDWKIINNKFIKEISRLLRREKNDQIYP